MQVPLDHSSNNSSTINLFVRDVSALSKIGHKLPTLLFLQGQHDSCVQQIASSTGTMDMNLSITFRRSRG